MMNSNKIILDLCGGTGSWSDPYKKAGYDVRLITLPSCDVLNYEPPPYVYGILAAPPCTEFSIAKDHKLKRDLAAGMIIVQACIDIMNKCSDKKFWCIENPVGHLTKFLGKPQYHFQPWFFGDPWTKRTYLWGKFIAPKMGYTDWKDVPKNENLYVRPGRKKPGIAFLHKSAKKYIKSFDSYSAATDADFRSITPAGFANAFFEENR